MAAGALLLLCAAGVRADSVVWTISDIAGFAQEIAASPNGQYIYYGCPDYDRIVAHNNQGVVAVGSPGGGLAGLIEYPYGPEFGAFFGSGLAASDSHVAIRGGGRVFVYNAGGGSPIAEYVSSAGLGTDMKCTSQSVFMGELRYSGTFFEQGRVRVYPWGPTTSPMIINHPEPAADDRFGRSIALGDSLVAFGVPTRGGNVGKVYLFDLATLSFVRSIDNPTTGADSFGHRIAMAGDSLFVAAGGDLISIPSSCYLFNAQTGDLIAALSKQHEKDFTIGGFTAQEGYLVVGNTRLPGQTGGANAGGYHIYDSQTGQHLWTSRHPWIPGTNHRWAYNIEFVGQDLLVGKQTIGAADDYVIRMDLTTPTAGVNDWQLFR